MTDYELCKELYELTGWTGTDKLWSNVNYNEEWLSVVPTDADRNEWSVPDYSTDYLRTKLPKSIEEDDTSFTLKLEVDTDNEWWADYSWYDVVAYGTLGDTPKTALLKLAIKLAKAGVIGKEAN